MQEGGHTAARVPTLRNARCSALSPCGRGHVRPIKVLGWVRGLSPRAPLAERDPSPNRACRTFLHALSHKGRGRNRDQRIDGSDLLDAAPATTARAAKGSDTPIKQRDEQRRSRGIDRPSYTMFFRPRQMRGRREGRVPTAPVVACNKARGSHHRYEPNIRPSLRDGFTTYT
jgi:hypothetical protein